MLQFEVYEKSPVLRHVEVIVTGSQLGDEESRTYNSLRKTAKVPGFRPGKVPNSVLRQMYGKGVRNDSQQNLIRAFIQDLLKQYPEALHLSPWQITEPKREDGGFSFALNLEVRPVVKVADYLGLSLEVPRASVSDADVDAAIEAMRLERAVFEPVEGRQVIEAGDFVTADIESDVAQLRGQDIALEVGSGKPLPDLDEALPGKAVGAPFDLDLTLPADFVFRALAGTPAKVTVTPRAINRRVLPALDDTLPQEVGSDASDLAALRAEVLQKLTDERADKVKQQRRLALSDALVARFPVDVPEGYVESRALDRIEAQINDARRQGMDFSSVQPLVSRMLQGLRPIFAKQIHLEFLLDAIAEKEDVRAGESDLETFFDGEAAKMRVSAEVVRQVYLQTPGVRAEILVKLRRDKTLDHLLAAAQLVEVDPKPADEADAEADASASASADAGQADAPAAE
jgi:trigger factor